MVEEPTTPAKSNGSEDGGPPAVATNQRRKQQRDAEDEPVGARRCLSVNRASESRSWLLDDIESSRVSIRHVSWLLTDFKDSIAAEHPVATVTPFGIFLGCTQVCRQGRTDRANEANLIPSH
ncbi:hypothetical protein Scep_020174 [Stephania cephalantha]|uniref:Uncharacterized protein n=1 Tax=Stephania cephalantha TaxID=152367 RepID=A0AAP0ICA6_9MAGN